MNKYINAFLSVAAVSALALTSACSKENPFGEDDNQVMGSFKTASLKVEVNPEENIVRSVADDAPELNSFSVAFFKEGEVSPAISYKYTEMPEIVTLPVGSYSAVAYSGENADAVWDTPYYEGKSEAFDIKADEVAEVADPIVCRLACVKVSINFDPELTAAMSADSKVTVKVGDNGSLDFTKADEGRHGYFAYVEDSHTLVAHFSGKVEDYPTSVSKARDNVEAGNHYIITFRLRSAGEGDPGTLNPGVSVDASVEVEDINGNVIPEDTYLEDDMRPSEGGGDEPTPPTPPGDDDQKGPSVKPGSATFPFNEEIVVTPDTKVEFTLVSKAAGGFSNLECKIASDKLTPEELGGVGLSDYLPLCSNDPKDAEMLETLGGMGFPTGNDIVGKSEVPFSITGFLSMLSMLGSGRHEFIITATDADGSSEYNIILRVN